MWYFFVTVWTEPDKHCENVYFEDYVVVRNNFRLQFYILDVEIIFISHEWKPEKK